MYDVMNAFYIIWLFCSQPFSKFFGFMEGFTQWVPENKLALRSNIFPPSTWWCEDRGGGSLSSERLHACMHACLPRQTQSIFFFNSFLIFCPSAWSSTLVSPPCLLVLSAFVLVAGHFVYSFVWLCKCQPQTDYFYLFYYPHVEHV